MKVVLTLLIVLTFSSCSSQNPTTKVLAKGVIYSWQICEMSDFKLKTVYFNFKFTNAGGTTKAAKSFGYIGFVGVEEKPELLDLIEQLRYYSNLVLTPETSNFYRGLRFEIQVDQTHLYLFDWDGAYIKLTKPNAKSLATDIEKSINLIK